MDESRGWAGPGDGRPFTNQPRVRFRVTQGWRWMATDTLYGVIWQNNLRAEWSLATGTGRPSSTREEVGGRVLQKRWNQSQMRGGGESLTTDASVGWVGGGGSCQTVYGLLAVTQSHDGSVCVRAHNPHMPHQADLYLCTALSIKQV